MKKTAEVFIVAISSIGSVLICFFIVISIILSVSFNTKFTLHRQSLIGQVQEVITTEEDVFFISNGWLSKYTSIDQKYNYKSIPFYHNGAKLSIRKVSHSNGYYAVSGWLQSEQEFDDFLQIYDESLELINEYRFDNQIICDTAFFDNTIYLSVSNREINQVSLKKVSINSYSIKTVVDSISKETFYIDGDNTIYIGKYHDLDDSIQNGKVTMSKWFDNTNNGETHNYYHELDLAIDRGTICLTNESNNYYYKTPYTFDTFYDNAYIIDNKIVFAVYKKNNSKNCGDNTGKCICRYGESFLYNIDLNNNSLELVSSFDSGTFLIDYNLDGAKYYCGSSLYINNSFYRACKTIEPGELVTVKNDKYLPESEKQMDLLLSFFKNEFYGI